MTTPASWTVTWAQAETQVTVAPVAAATITITPAGPLDVTVATATATGQDYGTFDPSATEVIYAPPAAVIQPAD